MQTKVLRALNKIAADKVYPPMEPEVKRPQQPSVKTHSQPSDPYKWPFKFQVSNKPLQVALQHVPKWEGFVDKYDPKKPAQALGFGTESKKFRSDVIANGGVVDVQRAWQAAINHLTGSYADLSRYKGFDKLNPNQQAALMSLHYNTGGGRIAAGSIPKLLAAGKYDQIPAIMAKYNKVRKYDGITQSTPNAKFDSDRQAWYVLNPIEGLTNRRNYEIALWNTPYAQ